MEPRQGFPEAKPGSRNKKSKRKADTSATSNSRQTSKSVVHELKLFQNSNLLNQQDPLEQLHRQINQLMQDEDCDRSKALSQATRSLANGDSRSNSKNMDCRRVPGQGGSGLFDRQDDGHSASTSALQQGTSVVNDSNDVAIVYDTNPNVATIKKGVLWQQRTYDKLHQRLFSRWKKRYFILTSDYLVCFKRSSSRVGHSEMGKFSYKVPLIDVEKVVWTYPKKSDKGAIIIHLREKFKLLLWCKGDLNEWMVLVGESSRQLRRRRFNNSSARSLVNNNVIFGTVNNLNQENGLYENAIIAKSCDSTKPANLPTQTELRTLALTSDGHSTNGSSTLNSRYLNQDAKISSRSSSESKKGMRAVPEALDVSDQRLESLDSHSGSGKVLDAPELPVHNKSIHALEQKSESATNQVEHIVNIAKLDGKKHQDDLSRNVTILSETHEGPATLCLEKDKNRIAGKSNQDIQGSLGPILVSSGDLGCPPKPLIRRDDSWQSLVSLNQIGRTDLSSGQSKHLVASRLRTTQNKAGDGCYGRQEGDHIKWNQMLNIESTVTPLRSRLPMRQQSMQEYTAKPPLGGYHKHDLVPSISALPNSPSLQSNQQTISYKHKLLQLQLLHSRNADYILSNGRGCGAGNQCDENNNDNLTYGPGSIATNHYGYYSMRSNLKSAASEFSFVRPNSSNLVPFSSNVPHEDQIASMNSSVRLSEKVPIINGSYEEQSPIVPMNAIPVINSNDRVKQTTNEPHNADNHLTLAELIAPDRDLPLKPNRRRQNNCEAHRDHKGSFGSSIVCFFRRAFSRRSKRRPRLIESCSSSLAAFDNNMDNAHVIQSAFSTGSKHVKTSHQQQIGREQERTGPQRMIDLIEAFASQTATGRLDEKTKHSAKILEDAEPRFVKQLSEDARKDGLINQSIKAKINLISPLHKSSSMSASIDCGISREHSGQVVVSLKPYDSGVRQQSPNAQRSTRIMSANLAPLFVIKDNPADQAQFSDPISSRQSGLLRHLPRPSSIYGQPSLIASSLVVSKSNKEAQFGAHRSSLHGVGDRDRSSMVDSRRPHSIRVPLDTTREVAEELSSPSSELPEAMVNYNNSNIRSNESKNNESDYHPRQALVNPIFQSPTMSAIYDNHPIASGIRETLYSHYDNNRPENFQVEGNHRDESINGLRETRSRNLYGLTRADSVTDAIISPLSSNRFLDKRNNQYSTGQSAFCTPTRDLTPNRHSIQERFASDGEKIFQRNRPAAILAHSTPSHSINYQRNNFIPCQKGASSHLVDDALSPRNIRTNCIRQQQRPPMLSQRTQNTSPVSPIAIRRFSNQTAQYQPSPLINGKTRVFQRSDKIQTTVLGGEPVVHIAGAPGINLDPSLAASLLRGTNIDAYQSSTVNRLSGLEDEGCNTKTFLISSRLSKAAPTNHDSNNFSRSTSEEAESSPTNMSRGSNRNDRSSKLPKGIPILKSRQAEKILVEKQQSTINDRVSRDASESSDGSHDTSITSSGKTKESNITQSGELLSQTASIEEPEEKNWVNSGLAE